jgi:hypothetical protein
MSLLSKHPIDWIIHFTLCFIPVYFGWATWFVVIIVGVIIEFEQKTQIGYNELSWGEYFIKHSFGDLIADCIGIIIGLIL